MEQHDGQPSSSSISTPDIKNNPVQTVSKKAINDFALRLPPPTQMAEDQAHLRIVSKQRQTLRRVRNGVLEATEQVTVPHTIPGQLWYYVNSPPPKGGGLDLDSTATQHSA